MVTMIILLVAFEAFVLTSICREIIAFVGQKKALRQRHRQEKEELMRFFDKYKKDADNRKDYRGG